MKNLFAILCICCLQGALCYSQGPELRVDVNQPGKSAAGNRIVLGHFANGAEVAFVRAGKGDWGIEISGNAVHSMSQPMPAQIELYRGGDNISDLASGYQSLKKEAGAIVATAKVSDAGSASFAVEDKLDNRRRCVLTQSHSPRNRCGR